jgi:hypothetical protein
MKPNENEIQPNLEDLEKNEKFEETITLCWKRAKLVTRCFYQMAN